MLKFKPSQKVKAIKDIRNDGTCAGCSRGKILVKSGTEGFVREISEFLEYEIINVHFIEENTIVGCLAGELEIVEDFDEDSGKWMKI